MASSDVRMRKLLSSALSRDRRLGVDAQVADGASVVTSAISADVVVVDVAIAGLGILGVMSGLHGSRRELPVIVVSRSDAIYLRHACLAEGAIDYLVLPEGLNTLADRVIRASRDPTAVVVSEPVPDIRGGM